MSTVFETERIPYIWLHPSKDAFMIYSYSDKRTNKPKAMDDILKNSLHGCDVLLQGLKR